MKQPTCTWLSPSRNATAKCGQPAVVWWFGPELGARCKRHDDPRLRERLVAHGLEALTA